MFLLWFVHYLTTYISMVNKQVEWFPDKCPCLTMHVRVLYVQCVIERWLNKMFKVALCAIFIATFGLYLLYIYSKRLPYTMTKYNCHTQWQNIMLSSKIKEWKLSKYKKTAPYIWRSPLSCLFIFYTTIVMKQYLVTFYAHLLQNIQLFSIYHIQFILSCE